MDFLILLILIIVFALIWGYQFIQLMVLSDDDFPGKFDKILWVVAFISVIPIAPFAFLYWKQLYLVVKQNQRQDNEEAT